MPKITFTENFDFNPKELNGTFTKAYKKGQTDNVTQECADQAMKAGKAKRARAGDGAIKTAI